MPVRHLVIFYMGFLICIYVNKREICIQFSILGIFLWMGVLWRERGFHLLWMRIVSKVLLIQLSHQHFFGYHILDQIHTSQNMINIQEKHMNSTSWAMRSWKIKRYHMCHGVSTGIDGYGNIVTSIPSIPWRIGIHWRPSQQKTWPLALDLGESHSNRIEMDGI